MTYLIFRQFRIEPGWVTATCALLLGVVGVVLLLRSRSRLQGTTLLGPWGWTIFAWLMLSGTETVIGLTHALGGEVPDQQLRYLAAMSLFCPQLSQIGARRPQARMWQVGVGVFWGLLCLPVVRAQFDPLAGTLDPAWVWGVLFVLLVAVGLLNNAPTRFAPTAWCLAAAQLIMTYPYLPWAHSEVSAGGATCAAGILLLGIGLVVAGWPGRPVPLHPEDRAWLDFRDSFGSYWALRAMQRVNDAAVRYDWGLWLTWSGFRQVEIAGSNPEFRDELRQGLCTCLRKLFSRFVDQAWLDRRLPRPTIKRTGLEDIDT